MNKLMKRGTNKKLKIQIWEWKKRFGSIREKSGDELKTLKLENEWITKNVDGL